MPVRVTVDARNVEKMLRKLPGRIRREVGTKFQAKAKEVKNFARSIAPRQRGNIQDAIYGLTYQDALKVVIGVSDVIDRGFNVTQWVTRQFPITVKNPSKYFDTGQSFMYGDPGVRSPSGRPVVWTAATPRWWEGVETRARRSFPQVARAAVRKALK